MRRFRATRPAGDKVNFIETDPFPCRIPIDCEDLRKLRGFFRGVRMWRDWANDGVWK